MTSALKKKVQVIDGRCSDSECKRKRSYLVPVHCNNCTWKGKLRWTIGHFSYSLNDDCPHCGCSTLERD